MDKNIFVFWRRIFAFCVDIIILFIVGCVLCSLFFELISSMGNWARLIGLAIFLAYFGIYNSYIGKGQTIGKKLFKIKVVDNQNNYLSLKASMIRALILAPAIVCSGMYLSLVNSSINFLLILCFYVGFIYFANISLLLFNKPTRQLLHDIIVQSSVTMETSVRQVEIYDYKKVKIICLLTLLLYIIVSILAIIIFFKEFDIKKYEATNNLLNEKLKNNIIYILETNIYNSEKKTTEPDLFIILDTKNINIHKMTNKEYMLDDAIIVADILINNVENLDKKGHIVIGFIRIISIGLGNYKHLYHIYDYPVEKWIELKKESRFTKM